VEPAVFTKRNGMALNLNNPLELTNVVQFSSMGIYQCPKNQTCYNSDFQPALERYHLPTSDIIGSGSKTVILPNSMKFTQVLYVPGVAYEWYYFVYCHLWLPVDNTSSTC